MAYNDEQFNQDVETALRIKSGFKGPIVPEAPGEEPATRRSDPGYAARQAALARPRMMAQGQDMESILGLDRYIFEKEKANVGAEQAMTNWDTRMQVREAKELRRIEQDLAIRGEEAKIEKTESEALKIRSEAGFAKTPMGLAQQKAQMQRAEKGLTGPPDADEIFTALAGQSAEKAAAVTKAQQEAISMSPKPLEGKELAELKDTMVRVNWTDTALVDYDNIAAKWGGPGPWSGSYGRVLRKFGKLPSDLQNLHLAVDKQGSLERKEFYGANLTATELGLSNRAIPNMDMNITQLKQVLLLNNAMDKWTIGLVQFLENKPRGQKARWSDEYRKAYPFPVSGEEIDLALGKSDAKSAGSGPALGEIMDFGNGLVGRWDGRGWEKVSK